MLDNYAKKPTLAQIRMLHSFDIPTLASSAGVTTKTAYDALLQRPISREDAQKIVVALAHYVGHPVGLDQVDIVLWEEYQILWVISAWSDKLDSGDVKHYMVYARDQNHAEHLACHWFSEHPTLTQHTFTSASEGYYLEALSMMIPGQLLLREAESARLRSD